MQLLLIAFAATIAGLSLAPFYVLPSILGWCLITIFLPLSLLLRKQHFLISLTLFFFFLLIFTNLRYPHQFSSRQEIGQIDKLNRKVILTGRVVSITQLVEGRSQLRLQIDGVTTTEGEEIVLETPLQVRMYLGEGTDQLLPGDLVRCRSHLRQPRQFGTPGEFNWPRFLASRHINMTGWVKNRGEITLLKDGEMVPSRAMVEWRNIIVTTIMEVMPEDRAWLVRALVLGEGRVIPDRIRRTLAKSGISHLFAISGLHLGMIGLLGYRLLLIGYRRCPWLLYWQPPQRVLPLLLLPLLLGYLLLTGDAVSTRRAFVLAMLGAVFLCWRYYVNPLLLLASLALLSLLVNPLLLWQAGWQLSFAGAAGILLWRPLWIRIGNGLPVYLRSSLQLLLVTFAAMLATLPLVLFNFHLFAPAGFVANIICVPIVTLLALPIGFTGLLCYQFLPQVSQFLFQFCGLLLELVLSLANLFTSLPCFGGTYLFLSSWQYLAVGLLVLPALFSPYLVRQKRLRRLAFTGFLLAIVLWQFPLAQSLPLTLTMFSVGQGESILLRNNYHQTVLIDGGGFYSDRFDVGERLLAPAFGTMGVTALDVIVLTHDDLDHRKGLIFILNHFPVGEFWIGNQFSELHYSLQEALIANNVPVKTIPAGWSKVSFWKFGNLRVFNGATEGSSKNNSSLVMYLDYNDKAGLLLTGDLEEQGVKSLLIAGLPGSVELLKIPHHGSRFSATDRLVDQTQPHYCLVSAGYQNRHHLPSHEVIDHLQKMNIPLYRTDLAGTLQAQWRVGGWEIKHWRRGFFVDISL